MQHLLATIIAQAEPAPTPQGPDISLIIMFGAIFAAFYFIVIMPMKRREKKERDDLLTKLKKNDEVLTLSGIIGIVSMIKDDEVVLKIDESSNVRLRVLKSAIARILNPKEPGKDVPEAPSPKSEVKTPAS